MKHLAINLTKYVQHLYVEKFKTDGRNQSSKEGEIWGRVGPLNIVKMSIISNLCYKFNKIHIKPPKFYFVDFNELILKFM